MKISLVIAAYNEEVLLPKCIDAILQANAKEKADIEIIVVNNASTDRTEEIAKSYEGVRVVNEKRKGLTWARQAGFEASTGELVALLDSDVMILPGWLSEVQQRFTHDPQLLALSGAKYFYDLPFLTKLFWNLTPIVEYLIHVTGGAIVEGGNFVVRRDALEKVGGFDTSIAFYGEDVDIICRLAAIGKTVWTFKLAVFASGRRIRAEGTFTMMYRYSINYLSMRFLHRPMTQEYKDIRD